MGFRPAALRGYLFLSFFLLKCCEVKPVDGLSNFLFLAVIDVYSREMMRT